MTIKNIYISVCIFVFFSFFFLWNVNIVSIKNVNVVNYNFENIIIKYNYLIFFLFFFIFLNKKSYQDFLRQKNIVILCFFIPFHYLINSIYDAKLEIKNIIFILSIPFLALIYCSYRNFLLVHFQKILFILFILFIFFSIYENPIYNTGSCNADYDLIRFLKEKLNITFSNSFFEENSHLAMMMVPVLFSSIFFFVNTNFSKNIIFLFFLLISIFISILNFSVTFYVSYFISIIFLFIFLHKKINFYFYFFSFILLFFFSTFFLNDINCKKKIIDFNVKDIIEQKVEKGSKNLTTVIYERSAIVTLRTLQYRPFGWGFNGMKKANDDFIKLRGYKGPPLVSILNLEDGLNNFFKMVTEFGIFSLIIIYFFFKYIANTKKIKAYNIFIIIIFITHCIRGAGYFSGGFILCIFELLYIYYSDNQSKQSPSK
jgi:hypothetical protein